MASHRLGTVEAEKRAGLLVTLAESRGADGDLDDAEDALRALVAELCNALVAGDADAPVHLRARLSPLFRRVRADLPAPTDRWEDLLQRAAHLEDLLGAAEAATLPARRHQELVVPASDTRRRVLAVLAGHKGQEMLRAGQVHEAASAAGLNRTPQRVGQVLDQLHRAGLALRVLAPAQGGAAPHYAISPQGRRVADALAGASVPAREPIVAPSSPRAESRPPAKGLLDVLLGYPASLLQDFAS